MHTRVCFYREQLLRLEHENKLLKMSADGNQEEQTHNLQSQLDDANARKNELETEVRYKVDKSNDRKYIISEA